MSSLPSVMSGKQALHWFPDAVTLEANKSSLLPEHCSCHLQ
uniref:Uncharacterized protein n=1 Tax=Arundo donax TaxID=35708 RepID=A0A0A9AL64_ARUDO